MLNKDSHSNAFNSFLPSPIFVYSYFSSVNELYRTLEKPESANVFPREKIFAFFPFLLFQRLSSFFHPSLAVQKVSFETLIPNEVYVIFGKRSLSQPFLGVNPVSSELRHTYLGVMKLYIFFRGCNIFLSMYAEGREAREMVNENLRS